MRSTISIAYFISILLLVVLLTGCSGCKEDPTEVTPSLVLPAPITEVQPPLLISALDTQLVVIPFDNGIPEFSSSPHRHTTGEALKRCTQTVAGILVQGETAIANGKSIIVNNRATRSELEEVTPNYQPRGASIYRVTLSERAAEKIAQHQEKVSKLCEAVREIEEAARKMLEGYVAIHKALTTLKLFTAVPTLDESLRKNREALAKTKKAYAVARKGHYVIQELLAIQCHIIHASCEQAKRKGGGFRAYRANLPAYVSRCRNRLVEIRNGLSSIKVYLSLGATNSRDPYMRDRAAYEEACQGLFVYANKAVLATAAGQPMREWLLTLSRCVSPDRKTTHLSFENLDSLIGLLDTMPEQ
ncbi:MAG: hypothetical protein ROO73_02615 [Roseivirga sp.]